MRGALCVAVLVAALVLTSQLPAQVKLAGGVAASGGGICAGGGNSLVGTAGQALTGITAGAANKSSLGFWYARKGMTLTDVRPADERLPAAFMLEQNYPNPFNPATVVGYQLPVAARVRLVVYDMLGREVAVLVNEEQTAGKHVARFEAPGRASGMYVCRMIAGGFTATKTMMLLR